MGDPHGTRDTDLVVHLLLAAILVVVVVAALVFAVPALFNLHSTSGDLGALATVVLVPAAAYLAARYLRRSWTAITDGDER